MDCPDVINGTYVDCVMSSHVFSLDVHKVLCMSVSQCSVYIFEFGVVLDQYPLGYSEGDSPTRYHERTLLEVIWIGT